MPKENVTTGKLSEFQILFEGAQNIMAGHGIDIGAPWQGSLDDAEGERYAALRDVVAFVRAETLNSNR